MLVNKGVQTTVRRTVKLTSLSMALCTSPYRRVWPEAWFIPARRARTLFPTRRCVN